MRQQDFHLSLYGLEIARGHDGFLRGRPEPSVVLAAYVASAHHLLLSDRLAVRFEAPTRLPQTVRPTGRASMTTSFVHKADAQVVILAMALEEDGGKDIQRVFGAFERHDALSLWEADSRELTPLHLRECVHDGAFHHPRRVHVMFDSREAGSTCTSDKWIGAALCVVRSRGLGEVALRFPFLAADERNDWTALVSLRL